MIPRRGHFCIMFHLLFFMKLEPLRGTYRGPVGHGIARWYKVINFDKCSLWFSINFTMEGSINVDSFDKSLLFSISFKMEDKISMSQRYISASTPKSKEPAIYLSQRYIPNNVTLKKWQKWPVSSLRLGPGKKQKSAAYLALRLFGSLLYLTLCYR